MALVPMSYWPTVGKNPQLHDTLNVTSRLPHFTFPDFSKYPLNNQLEKKDEQIRELSMSSLAYLGSDLDP